MPIRDCHRRRELRVDGAVLTRWRSIGTARSCAEVPLGSLTPEQLFDSPAYIDVSIYCATFRWLSGSRNLRQVAKAEARVLRMMPWPCPTACDGPLPA
jgi:hypothetical protein